MASDSEGGCLHQDNYKCNGSFKLEEIFSRREWWKLGTTVCSFKNAYRRYREDMVENA
jgi:hypothetical protein